MQNNVNKSFFTIEFYKQKPHWTTDYFDVLSGCKDSFEEYRNKVLIDKYVVEKVNFEFTDFENAKFQLNYRKYQINPYEIAYIKVIDLNNLFQGSFLKEVYFFVNNVKFKSNDIAVFSAEVDYWMTYWPNFKFNNKSLFCQRKHFPRYRTDKDHVGEYDFSTDSPILNIDNIESTFQNLTTQNEFALIAEVPFPEYPKTGMAECYAYCFCIPKNSDSVATDAELFRSQLIWTKVDDILKNKYSKYLTYLFVDEPYSIKGFPYFVFRLDEKSEIDNVTLELKNLTTTIQEYKTYTCYDYKYLSYLGDRIASVQLFDHPIFNFKFSGNLRTARNVVFIDGISQAVDKTMLNKEEVCCYSMEDLKLKNWKYIIKKDVIFEKFNFYKPLKEYNEKDILSLDQEPALFRYPHFEIEYSIYNMKGVYKVQNELILSEGYFDDYGNLFCDYVIHLNTVLKYVYVKNGWYKSQYNMWKYGYFEENIYNIDLVSEPYLKYLQENQYRFNTSINQTKWNMGQEIVEWVAGAFGVIAAPFTGGASLGITAAAGAMLSMGNSIKNGVFSLQQLQAQMKDLQRTPGTRINASNSFSNTAAYQIGENITLNKSVISAKGTACIRKHKENEQWILYYHFHQYGYLVNKRMQVKDLGWFYSRTWFDYFICEDFTNVIDVSKYNQMIINKFNNMFKRGIRLWHTIDNFLNYELNNKEIETWKILYLKK